MRINRLMEAKAMCDSYREDPGLSKDTNAILRAMYCAENRRQLGHCVVFDAERGWNVSGLIIPPPPKASHGDDQKS